MYSVLGFIHKSYLIPKMQVYFIIFFTHQLPRSAASFSLLPAQRRMLGWCWRRRTCVVTSASTLERKSSFTGYMLQANIMSSQIRMPNSSAICK